VVSALWVTLLVYCWPVGFSGKNVCAISGTLLVIMLYNGLFLVYSPCSGTVPIFGPWYTGTSEAGVVSLSLVAFFSILVC
jgi:hypothetical protein